MLTLSQNMRASSKSIKPTKHNKFKEQLMSNYKVFLVRSNRYYSFLSVIGFYHFLVKNCMQKSVSKILTNK